MNRDDFDLVLRTLCKRRPFRAFALELVSGSRIEVHHPEALERYKDEELLVYRDTAGVYSVFDSLSVVRFIDAVGTS